MEHLIGETAGKVYQCLADRNGGPLSLDAVRRTVGGPTALFHMAIGWLAREEKVSFFRQGRTTLIALTENKTL